MHALDVYTLDVYTLDVCTPSTCVHPRSSYPRCARPGSACPRFCVRPAGSKDQFAERGSDCRPGGAGRGGAAGAGRGRQGRARPPVAPRQNYREGASAVLVSPRSLWSPEPCHSSEAFCPGCLCFALALREQRSHRLPFCGPLNSLHP